MIEGSNKIKDTIRIKNDNALICKYLKKWSKSYEIKACYEASCNGYNFQRKMKEWGYSCDVIAPSLIPRKPGERRKNDFRDAWVLVRNYAGGLLSVVHPPSETEESVRHLVRCRLSLKDNSKNVKHQITIKSAI